MTNIVLSLDNSLPNQNLLSYLHNSVNYNVISFEQLKDKKATIIVNGPLTELANQLIKDYKLKDNIEQVLFIGGSATLGDVTVVAERNVYADVLSAKYVFNSELPIVMFGLDVTRNISDRSLLPIQYLENKNQFIYDECGIYVEASSSFTNGKTVCDVYSDKQFDKHCCVVVLGYKNK